MKQSCGILLYRKQDMRLEVLLIHPGGPFWAKKDAGAWSIPKGEPMEQEDLLAAAKREFMEETGQPAEGVFTALSSVTQKGGKRVHAWALEGNLDVALFKSNLFEMEWPPRSGKTQHFPEADKAQWFLIEAALEKILPVQAAFIMELVELMA